MGDVVIVAIPDENDHVWKVSSEKVPHLTLLFLGDEDNVSKLDQIVQFVEHAANTTLRRFYLTVDRRGELGEDKADVLFFKPKSFDAKSVQQFRSALLQNESIRTAHDSATQHEGPWKPHLTLGYPETPAKKDDRDFGIYEVSFNKVAVWTGDFEGPEFLLKDYWEEFEEMKAVPMMHAAKVSDTPWSNFKDSDYDDAQYARACLLDRGETAGTAKQRYGLPVREPNGTVNRNACHAAAAVLSSTGGTGSARGNKVKGTPEQISAAKKKLISLYKNTLEEDVPKGLGGEVKQADELGAEFVLEHFGVKGMHWGVRKDTQVTVNGKTKMVTAKKAAKLDASWEKNQFTLPKGVERHNAMADHANARLDKFNDDPRWKDKNGENITLSSNPAKEKEYFDAYNKEVAEPAFRHAVTQIHGSSPTGKKKMVVEVRDNELQMVVKDVDARHAEVAEGDEVFLFKIVRDKNGYVTSMKPDKNSSSEMTQTTDLGSEFVLEHFGVKGMRWGVRKEDIGGAAKAVGRAAGKAAVSVGKFAGDVQFESDVESGRAREMVINRAYKPFQQEDLPALKARHGDYGKLRNRVKKPFSKEARAYRKDSRETYIRRLETTANSMTNLSGDRQYTIRERGIEQPAEGGRLPSSKTYWDVSSRRVKHAVTDAFTRLEVLFDNEGWITGLKQVPVEDSMAQSMDLGSVLVSSIMSAQNESDSLEHFGVKGMRWGVRKERAVTTQEHIDTGLLRRRTQVQTKGGQSHPASDDAIKAAVQKQKLRKSGTAALSNRELNDLRNRMQLEAQVELLATRKGRKFVSRQLEEAGKQEFQTGLRRGVRTAAPHVGKKVKKGATTALVTALI